MMQTIPLTSVRSSNAVFANDDRAVPIEGHVVDNLERVVFIL